MTKREQMNIVIVGHVDHGKSTVIGRLMADTGSLPEGKLEDIKLMCERTSRPFEYAFLLDALKDERSQGITIDSARCFFKTELRDYIIIDAPGHIEFLKNMVSGAARAEAALLVIDAYEGVRENSRRHGYLVSMLGISQVVVLVNKMDLVGYDEGVFENIRKEYNEFLARIDINPIEYIPVSARNGDNIVAKSSSMKWNKGHTVNEHIDLFKKEAEAVHKSFRFPVQDIYKFTKEGDDRRIIAGTVETGTIRTGDGIVFLPSQKRSTIESIEGFNIPVRQEIEAGHSTGFSLKEEIYIKPGELMCRIDEPLPHLSSRFRVNIFWMGRAPMVKNKRYKLKLATSRTHVKLVDINNVIDASELSSELNKDHVDRHDVADCILETSKPIAYDLSGDFESTSRFVIVDNYEIAGGGIITEHISTDESILKDHIHRREELWEKGFVSPFEREAKNQHKSKFVVFTGDQVTQTIAKKLEKRLFESNYGTYYLGMKSFRGGLSADVIDETEFKEEQILRLGELARILTDSGQIFITSLKDIDDYDIEYLKLLTAPSDFIVINIGKNSFSTFKVDIDIESCDNDESAVEDAFNLLKSEKVIPDYII